MSIQEATTRITSGKVLERTAGLKDLIHILKHNRGKSSLESLSNKAYNSLCETLFKCMLQEKSSWIQSKSKSVKAAANLPLCATALRQTIIVGVRTFKNATVEAILENIAEALPLQGKSTLVKPLLEDLPKALRTLLEYQPHIERLSAERWDAAVDFCISSLSSLFVESEIGGDSSLRSTGRSNSQARTPLDAVDGTSFANSRDSMTKSRPIPDGLIHTAEDFMICLQLLVQPSNAPVIGKSEVILSTLVECLRRRIGRGYPAALAAINSVIARTKLHSVELTKRTIKDILPMVKSYWSNAVLRDELLIILMQTESHICSILSSKNEETAFFDLETVVETLYGDYRRRQETAAFQYLEDDHISFRNIGKAASDSHPLNTYAFSLGLVDRRCEGLWETTSLIARFSFMLDSRKRMNAQTREEGDDMPLKKLRITHHFQEYLRHVSEPRSNAKRAALQVVAFMIQEGPLSEDDLQDVLEKLTPFIADENSVHATWAMIGLTAAAFQSASTNPALLPYWISAWQSASRAFTSMSSSRTACHLMDILLRLRIVPFSAVSEIVRSMLLSIEIAGPALVTESSSSLLVTLLRERTAENPTYFDTTADRILYWLFSKWTPSLFPDRVYASLNAHHCNARDVLRVLHSCLDKPLRPFKASPFIVLGPVGQARAHAAQYRELIHYLLLLDTPDGFRTEPDEMVFISESPTSGDRPAQLEASVLDFCILETEKIKQRWKEWSREKERGITSDMMRIITNFCFAASAMASTANPVSTRLAKFVPALESLIRSFASFLSRREVDQYKADAVLEVLSQLLPDITSLGALDNEVFKGLGALPLAHHLSQALDGRKSTKESFYTEDDDFMDVDEPTNSQLAGGAPNTDIEVPRHDLLARTNTLSLRSSCALYLRLISTLADLPSDEDNQDQIPVEFIHYVVSLPEPDLLHSRQVIDALFSGRFILQKAACQDLFQRISERLIDPRAREYNTSEISHSMMVRILTGTSQIWCEPNDDESQELYENAEDLYAYYVKEMEKGGVRRSPNLQRTMVDLLIGLFMARPNFGNARKAPSVRTSLYEILDRGDIVAQYHIAQNLPRIFETYVLAQHERVFEDIQASLPHDPTWTEGIAIRVLVLSRLASRWYTLVRICVYGIFETAGMIETATKHAKRCTLEVARARQLEGPQTLFKLFAPQIIFSWLSTGAMDKSRHIADIPFSIFQYDTLADLLRDVEAEAIGQAVMFANREEVEYVARTLGTTAADALNKNFSRAAAYALAYDTCRGSQRNQSIASSIKLLSSLVGGEQFSSLMQEHFPRVLGIMLQTTAYEDKFEKALAKRPAFIATAKALAEMTKLQHSDDGERYQVFQPCFTAAYLFDLLDRLCRRANKDASNFWTASLYTFVMRMLLNRIHPALGSLYARSVIRKIRILVALAGEVAHKDYPLQMTLQSLRPFLTDVHCAEDTLGIMQYLFAHGTLYLGSELSFVTGISLSVLISIRAFLGSSQDSTTQESQYTTTKNKTQTFHSWFTRYLVNYADSLAAGKQFSSSYIKAFRSITTAASRVRTEGNSLRGTEESKLLLELLDDVRSRRHLLNPQSREVALDLLCQNFLPAPSSGDDVLGADADVAKYASQVWQSCQRSGVGDGYLLWAARVLGRTFSAHGELSRISSQSRSWPSQTHKSKDSPARCSRIAIVQKLLDLRLSDNREEVGLAEDGIRLILRRISDEEAVDLDNIVPRHIADALLFMSLDEDRYDNLAPKETLEQVAYSSEREEVSLWVKDLAAALCHVGSGDSILGSLSRIIQGIDGMAEKMLPYILHLVLLREIDADREVRKTMSAAYSSWFQEFDSGSRPYIKILIDCVLYLRTQKLPKEVTRVDRDKWLEVDFLLMAEAATACGMYKSALLFAETYGSQPIVISSSRRHSTLAPPPQIPTELQISIYKNLDEPDSYYGVEQESSLFSVLERLDYEGDGVKSLLFRGARMDSQMRRLNTIDPPDSRGTVKSLIMLNMNSVTQSLLSNDQFRNLGDETVESTLYTARKLGQWDIRAPEGNHSEASTLFKAFQGIHYASDALMARKQLDRQFLATMKSLAQTDRYSNLMKVPLRTLAVLNEADEVVSCTTPDQLLDCWDQMKARQKWMIAGQFDDVRILLSSRETLFSVISTNSALLESLRARPGTIRQMEVEALVSSSTICRKHGALQESLSSVTYLSDLVEKCRSVGLDIEVTAQHEVSSVLWEQGEAETSIRMRQRLIKNTTLDSQKIDISLPVLLAKLGHHLAEARLEQPESIIQEYLEPAIKELKGQTQGPGPGQVFHEYALFCDKQLQNPDAVEDLTRMKILMERKKQEATEFQKLGSVEKNKVVREGYKRAYSRALNWYKLDKIEYERLHSSRENFLKQCLENYLLSLQASDEYNTDVLRVFALWLEYSDTPLANKAVGHYLSKVPSGKFALLMNQLSSRLQAETTDFQRLLSELVFRICTEHPYHGMHQIFAMQNSVASKEDAVRSKDESSKSRQRAATHIAQLLGSDKRARSFWNIISQSDECYHNLAMSKNDQTRMGREIALDKMPEAKELLRKIPHLNVPPATLTIEIRANCDYTDVPKITGFKPRMSIANGLSAPKIISAIGSDGNYYKQLFKSGNDDLRQDAIMEQVFDQVSRLLKNHTATRLRNLGIRTYKVLPLSTRSGLMEFVPNTIPLHSYLIPAHEHYYPNDWKSDKCRKDIMNCSSESQATRVKVWQKIAANFHPIMRYFFIERFEDPDEWFEKRLAYTRSTAAISILGHVLGLGDRHCHNILLDEKSGEVVHIDLGVAFEAGRLLPVPEVVPFRLTRDLVDGMGYTKTEGVFRRCCEFTMDTLREERESIMTLLNVLRYDPLVNWSVTPTKAKRMQEGQDTAAQNEGRAAQVTTGALDEIAGESSKKREEQAGEAGRALSVVEKKLSKTLSTRATVNELIQTATDERNLAVLYAGWASYC
jgi:ataxia telangiectasia mutated family protein